MRRSAIIASSGMAVLLMLAACGSEPQPRQGGSGGVATGATFLDPGEPLEPAPSTASIAGLTPEATAAPAPASRAPIASAPISEARVAAERTAQMENCLNEGDALRGVTVAMADCLRQELRRQDDRLNIAYRAAMAAKEPAARARLQAGEREWIRARDAKCAGLATGGTIDQIEIPGCLLDETIRRRLALEAIARN